GEPDRLAWDVGDLLFDEGDDVVLRAHAGPPLRARRERNKDIGGFDAGGGGGGFGGARARPEGGRLLGGRFAGGAVRLRVDAARFVEADADGPQVAENDRSFGKPGDEFGPELSRENRAENQDRRRAAQDERFGGQCDFQERFVKPAGEANGEGVFVFHL